MSTGYYYLILIFCSKYFVELSLVWWVGLALERCTLTCLMCVLFYFYIFLIGDFLAWVLFLILPYSVFPMSSSYILSYTWPAFIFRHTHSHTYVNYCIQWFPYLYVFRVDPLLFRILVMSKKRTGFASLHSCWLTMCKSSCISGSL